jgi:hypothetical protein
VPFQALVESFEHMGLRLAGYPINDDPINDVTQLGIFWHVLNPENSL